MSVLGGKADEGRALFDFGFDQLRHCTEFNARTFELSFSPIKEFVFTVKMSGSDMQRDGFITFFGGTAKLPLCARSSCRPSGSWAQVLLRTRSSRSVLLCNGFAEYRYEI
jgi:hypothetical protein